MGLCDFCPAVDENVGAAAIYGPSDKGCPETGILAQTALNQPGGAIAEIDLAMIETVRAQGSVFNHNHWPEQTIRAAQTVEIVKNPLTTPP